MGEDTLATAWTLSLCPSIDTVHHLLPQAFRAFSHPCGDFVPSVVYILAMSSKGGFCSSFFLYFSSHCQKIPHVSRSKINQPHIRSLLSILNLQQVSHGCNLKVQVTYLGEYGCSRMGFSPPILHCYCSCSSSLLWISDPVQPWLLLGLDGGGNDVVMRDLIPLVVGSILICVVGVEWQRFTITEFLVVLLMALLRRWFVAGGAGWTARVSVVGWASYRAYALVFIVLRINFLILALLELRRKLIFLSSFCLVGSVQQTG